eukprot:2257918-Pleurochrysis_carterae.AAC.3
MPTCALARPPSPGTVSFSLRAQPQCIVDETWTAAERTGRSRDREPRPALSTCSSQCQHPSRCNAAASASSSVPACQGGRGGAAAPELPHAPVKPSLPLPPPSPPSPLTTPATTPFPLPFPMPSLPLNPPLPPSPPSPLPSPPGALPPPPTIAALPPASDARASVVSDSSPVGKRRCSGMSAALSKPSAIGPSNASSCCAHRSPCACTIAAHCRLTAETATSAPRHNLEHTRCCSSRGNRSSEMAEVSLDCESPTHAPPPPPPPPLLTAPAAAARAPCGAACAPPPALARAPLPDEPPLSPFPPCGVCPLGVPAEFRCREPESSRLRSPLKPRFTVCGAARHAASCCRSSFPRRTRPTASHDVARLCSARGRTPSSATTRGASASTDEQSVIAAKCQPSECATAARRVSNARRTRVSSPLAPSRIASVSTGAACEHPSKAL